jgi:hypothetical protein
LPLRVSDVRRFEAMVLVTGSCAVWLGTVGSDGYGRFAVRIAGRQRTVTPHQVAAVLAWGPLAAGVTLMHDCDVRLCVRAGLGHLRIGSQTENMRQAARRGRARGPRPGWVDVRGDVGASRAIQDALRASPDRSPEGLAVVLRDALAAGDPLRDNLCLFEL